MPQDLNIAAAAALADRHPNTIRSWVRTGLLPAYRVGPRDIRIARADLEAVLNRPVLTSATFALDPWRVVHARLRRERGAASEYPCAASGCDRRGREWSLTTIDSSMQWGHTPSGHRAAYSEFLANYTPRCATHARLLDRDQAADRSDGRAVRAIPDRHRARTAVKKESTRKPVQPTLFDLDHLNDAR